MQAESSRADQYSSTDGSLAESSEIAQHGNGIGFDGSVVDDSGEHAGDSPAVDVKSRDNPGITGSILDEDHPQLPQVDNWVDVQFQSSLDFRDRRRNSRGSKPSQDPPASQPCSRSSLEDLPNGKGTAPFYETSTHC